MVTRVPTRCARSAGRTAPGASGSVPAAGTACRRVFMDSTPGNPAPGQAGGVGARGAGRWPGRGGSLPGPGRPGFGFRPDQPVVPVSWLSVSPSAVGPAGTGSLTPLGTGRLATV